MVKGAPAKPINGTRPFNSCLYGAEPVGIVAAGKNHYNVEQFFSSAVGIHTDWLRAADVMLIGDQFNQDGSVILKIAVNPLIGLIWLAGIVFLIGSAVAMWPDAREQRQLARRSLELDALPAPTG